MRVARRTKILATIGPASFESVVLHALIAAGLDAVRLNFSHGTRDWHAEAYRRVREAARRHNREVAILQDLQGPKIRLGTIDGVVHVPLGSRLTITTREIVGKMGLVPTDYGAFAKDVTSGMKILLDDGRVSVVVRSIDGPDVVCEVVRGGTLSSNKGMNIPGAALTTAAFTAKDRDDACFGLELGVDFVALSFVRRPSDVDELRRLMLHHGRVVPIIAKIEKPEAIDALDEIIAVADGVMVARGDLAIEASLEMIPAYQKKIIERANRAGKLVITATQMLESMTENDLPTRAEVTDVANAILDGTDVVMLSGETAVGKHPVEVSQLMGSIATTTEAELFVFDKPVRTKHSEGDGLRGVSARIAARAAEESGAKAIVVFTDSGETAILLSDERPRAPILAFTRDVATERRLALYWGVICFRVPALSPLVEVIGYAVKVVLTEGWANIGESIVAVLDGQHEPIVDHSIRLLTLTAAETP